MKFDLITILIFVGVGFVLLMGIFALIAKFYIRVEQGKALIITRRAEAAVTFTGGVVWPIFNKAEVMDISVKTIKIDRRGKEGLICKDNIRADIMVTFFVRVNKTKEDVLKVAQAIGCHRASAQETIEELFSAKFSEALKTVGKQLEFEQLYLERKDFRDQIIEVIGKDLNGYALEDAAIDYIEQTPLATLDPQNILDSQGIKKITEITTQQAILTNDLKQEERMKIKKKNVSADEAVFEMDRQRAEAEAKQKREIATVQAREGAETLRVQAEERSRSELARIKSEEQVRVEEENKERQVQVAGKNRERVVGVEHERVERDRTLEAIGRERAVELQRIEKEKAVEIEKKAIADVVRERVAVDKTVAEEEERIKDVRALAQANRSKDTVRIAAEAHAVESMVKEVKAAEAAEEVAKHAARQQLTLASAELEAADKHAQARIRLSEGVQAEQAAEGLAHARVKEADAVATEKLGLAQVRVKEADAGATQKLGLAEVNVRLAAADATQKLGVAEAEVARQKLLAEAAGEQEKGMAQVRVRQADAQAIEQRGMAEATAVREKLVAEATGLQQKAEAMKLLDGVGKDHEEFRLRLDKEKSVELESIRVRRDVAEAQSKVLAEAFSHAKFNIVGGDGEFFDRFVRAVSLGQSVDGVMDNSKVVQAAVRRYLLGEAGGAGGAEHATVAALLGQLALGAPKDLRQKLESLARKAKELGVDSLTPTAPTTPEHNG